MQVPSSVYRRPLCVLQVEEIEPVVSQLERSNPYLPGMTPAMEMPVDLMLTVQGVERELCAGALTAILEVHTQDQDAEPTLVLMGFVEGKHEYIWFILV